MQVHTYRRADLCSYQNGKTIMYPSPSISDNSVLSASSSPTPDTTAYIQCAYQIAVGPVCLLFVLAVLGGDPGKALDLSCTP